jgi:hypothetical protein
MPCERWNAMTAARVRAPKTPSALIPRRCCSARTAAPVAPWRSPCTLPPPAALATAVGLAPLAVSPSARVVNVPTKPVLRMPCVRWNCLTARTVCGPKTPSAETPSRCWRARTIAPVEPRLRLRLVVVLLVDATARSAPAAPTATGAPIDAAASASDTREAGPRATRGRFRASRRRLERSCESSQYSARARSRTPAGCAKIAQPSSSGRAGRDDVVVRCILLPLVFWSCAYEVS